MTNWNYADVWETVADVRPDSIAVTQGDHHLSWRDFDRGADGVAQFLLDQNVVQQDKIAVYLYNCPEYLQACFAAIKIGLVPVNTNYRYGDDELTYLWSNADAVAVVFHGTFVDRVERIRDRVPDVRAWLWVDDGSGPCPDWATPYETAAKSATGRVAAPWGRSGDDLLMIYTGGTTGMPKGVMWRQDDLFARLINGGSRQYPLEGGIEAVRHSLMADDRATALLPACPLMHGTGWFTTNLCLAEGGRVVLLASRRYDPVELLDTVVREKVNALVIVGDPFSRPLVDALNDRPGHWDLSSLALMVSSGAMWSEPIKEELLRHHPGVFLVDAFSSSEAIGMGTSVSGAGNAAATAKFTLGPEVKVLKDDGTEVTPGSDEIGVLALGGRNPLGYYKDEEKSNRTFKTINGVRYSVPGDFAQVDTDGTIHLLGRGSVCINSGGEKIFPEEVEEVLKTHPGVRDAVVVGIPHPIFGEEIVGVIELAGDGTSAGGAGGTSETGGAGGAVPPTDAEIIAYVKQRLAGYKAPRRVRVVATIGRAPNGKVDYRRHRAESIEDFEATA
jgi:acyl-CoA synthetase (AMP-forming)/AMP-acid ligase II